MEEIRDIISTIDRLNDECFLESGIQDYLPFWTELSGDYSCIKFMGEVIWQSEDDMREWIDDDEQEPLYDYVLRESRRYLADLNAKMSQI